MIQVPRVCLLELTFKIIRKISNLPHFYGPHLFGLFRNAFRKERKGDHPDCSPQIYIQPWETGNLVFMPGERMKLGISFRSFESEVVANILETLRTEDPSSDDKDHFTVGGSLLLEEAICRISNVKWDPKEPVSLSYSTLEPEILRLMKLPEFSLVFFSPLRLKRPESERREGHRFCDEDFFLNHGSLAIPHLLESIADRVKSLSGDQLPPVKKDCGIFTSDCALSWFDCSYGTEWKKSIGGVIGSLTISGKCGLEEAELLVLGQYLGVGKNLSLGFGFYHIPELDEVRLVKKPERTETLLDKVFSFENLERALIELPNSSPGPDGITVEDLRKVKHFFLPSFRDSIFSGGYKHGDLKKYKVIDENEVRKTVLVQTAKDRFVTKVIADYLFPLVVSILSSCGWAKKRGLTKIENELALGSLIDEGFRSGLLIDREVLFESIDTGKLSMILTALFPFDPLTHLIQKILLLFRERGLRGLPKGNSLSHVLLELFLERLVRRVEMEGLRIARDHENFVILGKDLSKQEILGKLKGTVIMNPNLKEKGVNSRHDERIKFIGHIVSEDKEDLEAEWVPIFKENWGMGRPIYLTSRVENVYSSGSSLHVVYGNKTEEKVPWSEISRIVIVGRPRVTSGVIYRAIKENLPVSFIDVFGRQKGVFFPEKNKISDLNDLIVRYSRDREFCLKFSKEIVSAKIHNSYVILRRNGIIREELKNIEKEVRTSDSLDSLRGYEGLASRIYFSEFANLVHPFEFSGRNYHPPSDPVNAMLSLGYTLIYNRIASALKMKGINPRIGFFHKGRGGHFALASDLLEELRHVSERIVLALIHRGEIRGSDFSVRRWKGKVITALSGEGLRKFIKRYEWTMDQKTSYEEDEMTYNAYIDEMAEKLKRSLKLNVDYRALRID